jgi:hypothetical protein
MESGWLLTQAAAGFGRNGRLAARARPAGGRGMEWRLAAARRAGGCGMEWRLAAARRAGGRGMERGGCPRREMAGGRGRNRRLAATARHAGGSAGGSRLEDGWLWT